MPMRCGIGALLLSSALLTGVTSASAQSPRESPMCDAVKQLLAIRDLMSLAIGPLVDLGPGGDPVQLRGPGQAVVPGTTDCKVHRTDYKSQGRHDLSYYCEMTDAQPRSSNHKAIVRGLNARLHPCLPGWNEQENFHESSDSSMAFLNTYSVDYTKGRRKIAIIRIMSLDDNKAMSTTFNVIDKFDN
jgi:hypothetical protein